MKKTKMQKGITLIALIITIVVLLILAIVTIGAVKDSGIIGHAQDASSDYTIAQEKEQIGLALSEWQIEKYTTGKSFKEVISAALSGTATVEGDDDGPLTITMDKTGNQYSVTDNGEIVPVEKGISLSDTSLTIIKERTKTIIATVTGGLKVEDITYSSSSESIATVSESGVITAVAVGETIITASCGEYSATCKVTVREANDLDYYLFGQDLEGRIITTILDVNTGVFSDDPLTEPDESDTNVISIVGLTQDGDIGTAYFKYQGVTYKARANMSTGMTDAEYGVVLIYDPAETSKVGKTVKYDNKLWTILYDDDINGLQMICNLVLEYNGAEVYLGSSDSILGSNWDSLIIEADINKDNKLDTIEKAVYSYNNAIDTLNAACKNLVTTNSNIIDVRSVGSNPINKKDENKTLYTTENLEEWPTSNENYLPGTLNGVGKCSDDNYISDYEKILALGKNFIENDCWLASRIIVEDSSEGTCFNIRTLDAEFDKLYYERMWRVTTKHPVSNGVACGVCPVVSLKPDIQFFGSGTEADPYTFN